MSQRTRALAEFFQAEWTTTDGRNPSAEYEIATSSGETCAGLKSFQTKTKSSPVFHKNPRTAVANSRKSNENPSRLRRCRKVMTNKSA